MIFNMFEKNEINMFLVIPKGIVPKGGTYFMRKFLVLSLAIAFLLSISVVTLVSAETAKPGAKAAPAAKKADKPAAEKKAKPAAEKKEKKAKKEKKTKDIITGVVNINEADAKLLDKLPEIGPKTAQKIIKARPFASIDELISKKALSQKDFDAVKAYVAISGASDLVVKVVPAQPVNLNTASAKDLMLIPDVGEKTAKAIIGARPIAAIEDLDKVEGIGPKTLAEIKAYGTIK